ncbi:hypothetical protein [Natrinema marinum]|uniref:hypothetical protein n=1 Tax=Natrinema marinum TaxID=2961598 RepID=UPI0020C87EA0|nr:hypothetical protein [Natrinema marinum]
MGAALRAFAVVLAVLVLLLVGTMAAQLPQPYPTWPTIGPVPVTPELVVPGVLGLLALFGVVRNGITLGSILVGLVGALTLWLAGVSLYSLYAGTAGSLFGGGLLTLMSGTVLAVAVLLETAIHRFVERGVTRRLSDRLEQRR